MLGAQQSFGGTWITHRFPGIRSDSDLYTFGYRFKPWTGAPIATAAEILRYMSDVIDENDLARHIRSRHRIDRAHWSSADNLWTVDALCPVGGWCMGFMSPPTRGTISGACVGDWTKPKSEGGRHGPSATSIRPFQVNVSEAELTDLRKRINATKWPEREPVSDQSQGVQLATMEKLARYWGTDKPARPSRPWCSASMRTASTW